MSKKSAETKAGAGVFATTHWSVVLAAGQSASDKQALALEKLCRAYWYPLYAYIRRRGHRPEDAQDLTQDFFLRLIEKEWLADIVPEGARFRSFLLTMVRRYLANAHDRVQAVKRGGGSFMLSLDIQELEARFGTEPATHDTPETAFEHRWALTVLDEALGRLRQTTNAAGKEKQFELLQPFLSREPNDGEYQALAGQLNVRPGAVGVAVHRLRQRYREELRATVADTLADSSQVDEELRHVLAALLPGR